MQHTYYKQRYAVGFWKVGEIVDMHTARNGYTSILWILREAIGGNSLNDIRRTQVSQLFTRGECDEIAFSRMPKRWQRALRAKRLRAKAKDAAKAG